MPGIIDPLTMNELSSDHLSIAFVIPYYTKIPEEYPIFHFAKANWKKLRQLLELTAFDLQQEFKTLNSTEEIDECTILINSHINNAIEKSVPKKKNLITRYKFSAEILNLTKNRNFYRRKFKETLDPAFKSISNQLSRMIKSRISLMNQDSFNSKIVNLDPLDNSLYRFSKSLKMKKSHVPPLNNGNSTKAFTKTDKANAFAEGFHKCHQTNTLMKSKKEKIVKKSIRMISLINPLLPSAELVQEHKIVEIIRNLKNRKAPGPDKIPNSVIKNFPQKFVHFLTEVFNSCLRFSYFPKCWKVGKIVAILKPGKDPSVPTNYRPISLLSNIGKIYEKILLDKLIKHEDDHKIIIPQQFGFRNGHPTVQQILRITEHASKNFNINRSTGLVLLDIEKAYDSVWHDALIHKLYALKFPVYLVKVVQSYLRDRKAFVDLHGQSSVSFEIPSGVPQGSLLSPFLFNIFINDMTKPKNCQLAVYADDTALFCDAPWKNIKKTKENTRKCTRKSLQFL